MEHSDHESCDDSFSCHKSFGNLIQTIEIGKEPRLWNNVQSTSNLDQKGSLSWESVCVFKLIYHIPFSHMLFFNFASHYMTSGSLLHIGSGFIWIMNAEGFVVQKNLPPWSVDLGLLQVTSVTPVIWRLILITSYNMITYLPLFRSQIVTILHLTTDVAIIEGMHSTLSETASV